MLVTVLGAGSWGTTVASLTAARNPTVLWARRPETAVQVNEEHLNSAYLPGVPLAPVNHLEVWDNGNKLGNSPIGSTVAEWYPNLSAGTHAISILAIASNGTMRCFNAGASVCA